MISKLVSFSIARRWLVILITVPVLAAGIWSLLKIPIDAVPDITNNQVQVTTTAPSLSPVEIEKLVTYPIEIALAGIPGLEYTRSLSRNAFSQVTAVFTDKTNLYFARQQISERLIEIRAGLPAGAQVRMGPVTTGLGEIYMWCVSFASPRLPAARDGVAGWQSDGSYLTPDGQVLADSVAQGAYLRTIQDWIVRPQIRNVQGVAGVDSIGGYAKQFQVMPDAARLAALQITLDDLARAIEANNLSRGAGVIERGGEGFVVRATGRAQTLVDIGNIVVVTRESVPVRVRDLAEVAIGGEIRTGSASEGGREVVIGTALMLIGANSRTVAQSVDKGIADLKGALPPGISLQPLLNRTQLVDATIVTVSTNLLEGALLVIAVLFLLLGNIRAALITAIVIPVAMLMTASGMLQGRISANLMSLGAIDFGLIVDGAVIITENCLRGLAARQAALGRILTQGERLETVQAAAGEMLRPSAYGQAIIILVYVPLLTFTGVEGKMFQPMALTVIMALISAFVLSMTLVPALIAVCINNRVEEKESAFMRRLHAVYAPWLRTSLKSPLGVVAGAGVLFAVALFVFVRMGQEFIPTLDERNILMSVLRIPSTGLDQSQRMQSELEKAVSGLPEVAYVFSKTGTAEVGSDPMPPSASDTFIMLKAQDHWPDAGIGKDGLIKKLEQAVSGIPGNALEFTQPIQMRFNELLAGTRGDVAVKIFGDDFEPMLVAANQIAAVLRSVKGAADIKVEQVSGLPVLEIVADRQELSRRGISLSTVHDVIGAAIGGREAGEVFEGDRRFSIVIRLSDAQRSDIDLLKNMPVPLPANAQGRSKTVPLQEVAAFRFTQGPNQVSRENGKRRVVVSANVRGASIASVVGDAKAAIAKSVTLPTGYFLTWGGQFENLEAARNRMMLVVPACFALIFVLLFYALGSLRDALMVSSAVPLALTGGVFALALRGMPFSVSAAVGFIALSGIAVLNGLVMLSSIRALVRTGVEAGEAVVEGALLRLRPVAMTALVASLGFVPMALATGTGAEVQRPIATVVIGGLITATLLTLFVLPALIMRFGSGKRLRIL